MAYTTDLPFFKYSALGNDYIVLDPATFTHPLTVPVIQAICHRNHGIGSDGILYGPHTIDGNIHLQIFNPDGSEAEKSGNGIRIFSKYLFDTGYITDDHFTLHTKGGTVYIKRLNPTADIIQVDMGAPIFTPADIPITGDTAISIPLTIHNQDITVNCVSMGNPHCVIFTDALSKDTTCTLGPKIETHPMFPNKTNVQFVKVISNTRIQIEIWERGAGYTLASGSSSCAAAAVAMHHNLVDAAITVAMPGGTIDIAQTDNNHMLMTGPVSVVGHGFVDASLLT
jgi:diaminopimelate epimerase